MAVGGNSKYEVPLNLHTMALRRQTVLGVHRGSRRQLQELVSLVATGKVRHHIPADGLMDWKD